MKNKKILMLLLAAALLIGLLPASAAADPVEPYEYVEEASSGNAATESFTVRTPSDEPCTLYVSGTVTAETKALSIGVVNVSGTFLRVFAFPDENGEFSFSVNTSVGNTAFPTAIARRPRLIAFRVRINILYSYYPIPFIINLNKLYFTFIFTTKTIM